MPDLFQQALSNASIDDFLIVEYLGDLGGRVAHTTFGVQEDGTPYTIELGANWVSRPVFFICNKAKSLLGSRTSNWRWSRKPNLAPGRKPPTLYDIDVGH